MTFRPKSSVLISEVSHVAVRYHVTNVEEKTSPPFLDDCHMTTDCHITSFTDENRWLFIYYYD